MKGYADKGGAYPLSVIPRGNGHFEVRNLQTGTSHGVFSTSAEAGDAQERELQKIHAAMQRGAQE